jgi:hypothetical protein
MPLRYSFSKAPFRCGGDEGQDDEQKEPSRLLLNFHMASCHSSGVCDFKGVIQMKRNGVKFIVRKKNDITAAIIFFLIAWLGAILICLFTKTGGWVTLAIILALQLFCLPYLIYSATWKLEICANSFRTTCFFREKEYAYSQIKRVLLCNEFREGVTLWLFLQDGKMIKVAEDYKNFNRFHRFIQSKRSIECER